MRLIDADEYEKRIKPYDTEDVIDKALYNFAHEKLITTPTAQPEPQKWLDHNYYLECPSCKRYVTNRTPFCPYCGGRNE